MAIVDIPTRHHYDAVVIGGGPAGSTVANVLASRGRSVLVVEKQTFPRHQIGESLIPATVHGVLPLLGVDAEIQRCGFVQKGGASFRWGESPNIWTMRFSQSEELEKVGANFAYQVERAKFDKILLDKSSERGAEVLFQGRVEHDAPREGLKNVTVSTAAGREIPLTASYVVDASGHGSKSHQHLGGRVTSEFFRNSAVYGYFEGASLRPAPYTGNIICEAVSSGWVWFIPLRTGERTLVSVGVVLGTTPLTAERREALYRQSIEETLHIKHLLATGTQVTEGIYAGLRTRKEWSYTTRSFYRDGLAVVGDSACFVDPILSTGVHFATYGGLMLGRAINSSFAHPESAACFFEEFEARYRLEYQVIYRLLLAFYDMNSSIGSYYWEARGLASAERTDHAAFARVLGGATSDAGLFEKDLNGLGDLLQTYAHKLEAADLTPASNTITAQLGQDLVSWGKARSVARPSQMKESSSEDTVEDVFARHCVVRNLDVTEDKLAWLQPQPA